MTEEQQNNAIAEAAGWKPFPYPGYKGGILLPYRWSKSPTEHAMNLPCYTQDLNAMNEVEKLLTNDQWPKYEELIEDERYAEVRGLEPRLKSFNYYRTISATASQRAKAFLVTIGKWECNADHAEVPNPAPYNFCPLEKDWKRKAFGLEEIGAHNAAAVYRMCINDLRRYVSDSETGGGGGFETVRT